MKLWGKEKIKVEEKKSECKCKDMIECYDCRALIKLESAKKVNYYGSYGGRPYYYCLRCAPKYDSVDLPEIYRPTERYFIENRRIECDKNGIPLSDNSIRGRTFADLTMGDIVYDKNGKKYHVAPVE